MSLFSIVCLCPADSNLHDSTNDTMTLVCQLMQNYFKDILIPNRTAILLNYNIKKLLKHLACYNLQNGISICKIQDISGAKECFATIFYLISRFHKIFLLILLPKGILF